MTHTLHRRIPANYLREDYVVLTLASKGINTEGHEPKLREFLRLAQAHNSKNIGSGAKGRGIEKPEATMARARSMGQAVFDNKEDLTAFLKALKEAKLGVSVVVSGSYQIVDDCLKKIGIEHHTGNFSLGIWGNTKRLPDNDILSITTMCGHGLIPNNLVKAMVKDVKSGKKTPEQAAAILNPQCACGIFNPTVAAKILKEMESK